MKQTEVDYFTEQLEEFDAKLAGKLPRIKLPMPEKKKPSFFKRNKKAIYKTIQFSLWVDWIVVLPILILVIKHALIFTFCTLTGLVDVAVFTGAQRDSMMDKSMFISVFVSIAIYGIASISTFNFIDDELREMRYKR